MRARLSSTKGFSLTELAVVLTLFGVIIGSVWMYSAQAYNRAHEKQTEQQITTILANIQRVFANTSSATGSADVTAMGANITTGGITAGIFPAEMIDSTGTIVKNATGGSVTLGNTSCNSAACIFLSTQVPVDACAPLVIKFLANAGVRQKFGIIGYAWGATQPSTPTILAVGTSLSVVNIGTLCGGGNVPWNAMGWLNIYTNR